MKKGIDDMEMNFQNDNRIHYITLISSQVEAQQVKLLIESLRRFGGRLGAYSVWIFCTDVKFSEGFSESDTLKIFHLKMDVPLSNFPLAEKVFACALAEEMAALEGVHTLIWLNPDCLIFNPPELFILGDQYDAAFRPVHIRNVGSLANESIDGYWQRVYEVVRVNQVPYTIESFVDGQTLRPYFNTHCFAINPTKGILQAWRAIFVTLLMDKEFQDDYCQDEFHQIFLHQVVLSALVMKSIQQKRLLMLPHEYSYPLHLQEKLLITKRVKSLNQLVCMVYEEDTLLDGIEIQEPIRSWLKDNRKISS
ncbi:MAG: hypothetical protein IH585_14285 [Anaerolineaceae bacterium]|nr:hypothetical protein [Anaerolineaceae bacterium]